MQELLIEAGHAERQYWRDLWCYRELLYFLAWRDILVRYKQTVVGVAWSVVRPLLTMAIFTIVFSKMAKMPSNGTPYPLLVMCGTMPWQFFSGSLTDSGSSLVTNTGMISKIYFPRMILPASKVVIALVDFMIAGAILALMGVYYHFNPAYHFTPPGLRLLLLPAFLGLAFGASLGVGLWISALMVPYRDFRFIVPFIVQFGTYVSPVGFLSSVVPDRWRLLYSLNPMVGVIDGFRWAVLGGKDLIYWPGLAASVVIVTVLISSGIWFFRRTERTFADVI